MSDNPNALTYRHWFFIALLALINVIILAVCDFGCDREDVFSDEQTREASRDQPMILN